MATLTSNPVVVWEQSLVGGMKGGHGSGVGAVTCGGNEGWAW